MMWLKQHTTMFLLMVLAIVVAVPSIDQFKLLEDDPLSIEHAGETEFYTLSDGEEFTFERSVCVTKDLLVAVHREFHNLDTGDKYMLSSISYAANAADGCYSVQFAADVPARIPSGRYEYRPILIYKVNDKLTITKPAPFVTLEIVE